MEGSYVAELVSHFLHWTYVLILTMVLRSRSYGTSLAQSFTFHQNILLTLVMTTWMSPKSKRCLESHLL
jgi:hypothetical protein